MKTLLNILKDTAVVTVLVLVTAPVAVLVGALCGNTATALDAPILAAAAPLASVTVGVFLGWVMAPVAVDLMSK